MAKKKADTQAESNPHKPQNNIHHNQTMDDDVSEKLDSLKSLNALLLKETVERRQQVDSLVHSNGNLESRLNRSVMDNKSLQSEMTSLIESAMMLEIEKDLVFVFVTSQVSQLADESIQSLKETIGSLEGDMERVLEEKNETEKSRSQKESEILDLKSRLDKLITEFDEQKIVSSRVCDERDEIRAQLDARIQEVNELRLKVTEAEENAARISKEVTELKVKYEKLIEENTAIKIRYESVTSEKDVIQSNLVKSNGQIDDLKRNIEELLRQKKAIEDEKNTSERNKEELQTTVGELKDLVESLKTEEKALLEKFTDLEKKFVEKLENEVELQKQIDVLVEEQKETNAQIETLDNDKILVTKEYEDAIKKLDHQELTIDQILQEKTELENAKIQGENEIVKMKEQLSEFKDTISSLENSSIDQNEKLKQLENDVSHYKSSFDQATLERNEALESLDEEKAITTEFKQKITKMENEIEDLHKELAQMTKENKNYEGEKNELESRCASLVKEVALLETKLAETQIEVDTTKSKLGLAEAKSNKVLNILKRTVSSSDEGTDFDNENGVEEGIKDHVTEVIAIKRVFKEKESRVEEMQRQLESIKKSADEAQKGKSFWTMVSSATTLLAAAASVAYVARAH